MRDVDILTVRPRCARPRRRPQPAAEGQRPRRRRQELRLCRRPAAEGARARPLRAPHRSPCQRAGGAAGARADLRREDPLHDPSTPRCGRGRWPRSCAAMVSLPSRRRSRRRVLRASVDQVVVDVVVTDADGAPVLGLTAADFEVRERGTPQSVATFSEVSLPVVRRGAGTLAAAGRRRALQRPRQRRPGLRPGARRRQRRAVPDARRAAGGARVPASLRAARRSGRRADDERAWASTRQEPTEDLALVDAAIARFAGHGGDYVEHRLGQGARGPTPARNADPMTDAARLDDADGRRQRRRQRRRRGRGA